MSASRSLTTLCAASAIALIATLNVRPAAAQNPAPPAPQPSTCDSACHARMMAGGTPGAMGHMQGMSGGQGMACPMMGAMQGRGGMPGMGGMHRMQGMHRMPGMPGMAGMGPMAAAPDSATVREMADRRATATRAYYEALMRRGFTSEQALRIVAAQTSPAGR